MRTSEKIVAVTAATASAAAAGTQAVADGFEGSYGGLALASFAPSWDSSYNYGANNQGINGFIGYNWAISGGTIAGVELSAWASDVDTSAFYGMGSMLEAKFRVGKAFNSTMLYGAVGAFQGNHQWDSAGTAQGISIGLGMEMNFGSNMFGGVEYTHRVVTSDDGSAYKELNGVGTMAFRFGFRF